MVACWLSAPWDYSGLMYGYAFRGHWFWINDYGPNHITYIVWKDYNCFEWQEYNTNDPDGRKANNYSHLSPE